MKQLLIVCEVVLVGVSFLVLALPEARTPPMYFILRAALFGGGLAYCLHTRKFLRMTPRQTYESIRTSGAPLSVAESTIWLAATILTIVALVR